MSTELTKQTKAAEETLAETTVKPPRAPRQKLRPIAELDTIAPTAMTRDEAMKYIKFMREENLKLQNKVHALEDNIKSAFAKVDYISKSAEQIEQAYAEHLNFIMSSIKNLKTSCECASNVTIAHVHNLKKGV